MLKIKKYNNRKEFYFLGIKIASHKINPKEANSVFIRCGEYPHLIFDKSTGKYLGKPETLSIGTHVWVCANSTLLTHANIPNGCIIGTNAIVTKKFDEENSVIAGNPARICKRDIFWERDVNSLPQDSIYYQSFKNKICEMKVGNYA